MTKQRMTLFSSAASRRFAVSSSGNAQVQDRNSLRQVSLRLTKNVCLTSVALLLAFSVRVAAAQQEQPKSTVDTVVFNDNEQLTGVLVKADSKGVTFKSPVAGELKIDWSNIKELRTTGSFAVITKDQQLTHKDVLNLVPRGSLDVASNTVQVQSDKGSHSVPVAQVDQVLDSATFDRGVSRSPGFFGGWTGAVSANAGLVRATQNSTTFTGTVALVRALPSVDWLPPRNRTLLDYSQSYGSTSEVSSATITTNIFHAGAERDEYLKARLYLFAIAAFDHDFSQGLDLQQQYGGGLGYTVLKSATRELDVKGDVHYEKQEFSTPSSNRNLFGSTFAENYLQTLPRTIVFSEFASISPSWNDTSAYSARIGASLVFPVYRGFAFNIAATDDYLNNAPSTFKKNATTFSSGIVYTFQQR